MKLDEEVKMISAEAPIIFAKAAELFIQELTVKAWQHTEENKRRTLQKNDITLAISKYDEFDFLIDIVPREEKKPSGKKVNCLLDSLNSLKNYQKLKMANLKRKQPLQIQASTQQPVITTRLRYRMSLMELLTSQLRVCLML
jgi:nuclear transcription factor Y gamma